MMSGANYLVTDDYRPLWAMVVCILLDGDVNGKVMFSKTDGAAQNLMAAISDQIVCRSS